MRNALGVGVEMTLVRTCTLSRCESIRVLDTVTRMFFEFVLSEEQYFIRRFRLSHSAAYIRIVLKPAWTWYTSFISVTADIN
jgi:hypothetical protein